MWKNLRYQVKNVQGEILAESRYFKMIMYLWINMKDRQNLTVIDTHKNKIIEHTFIKSKYRLEVMPFVNIYTTLNS